MASERAVERDLLTGADTALLEFAIQVAGRRIERHPEDARLRVQRARWMILCGRWDEQRIDLQVADRIAPDHWIEWAGDSLVLLQGRANGAARGRDWPGALRTLARLRTIRPEDADYRDRRWNEAVRDLDQCMAASQTFLPEAAGFVLAMVYQKTGRTEEVRRQVKRADARIQAITKEDRENAWKVSILVDVLRREALELVSPQESRTRE